MRRALAPALAVVFLTLPYTSFAGPRATQARPSAAKQGPQARPTQRKAKPIAKAARIPLAKQRARAVRPARNAQASAELAALLRAYVRGGSSKFEKKVAKGMPRRGVSKDAARRLLTRIEGARSNQRKALLGNKALPGQVTRAFLVDAVAKATASHLVLMRPAISLPPEGIPLPTSYALEQAGLVTTSTEDGDGTDELTTFGVIAKPTTEGYDLTTVDLSTNVSAPVGTQALAATLYDGAASDALVITALIEGDEGNAATAREEIEVLIGLAASVAGTMPGTDRLAVLETMVDYTLTLDAVGSDPSRAARSVVATAMGKSDWAALWAADEDSAAGTGYKVAVPHAMGSGSYELLLTVPAELPAVKTIRLTLADFAHDIPTSDKFSVHHIELRAEIGDEGHTFQTAPGDFKPLERKVVGGDVSIGVSGLVDYTIHYPATIKSLCDLSGLHGYAKSFKRKRCNKARKKFRKKHGLESSETLDFAGAGDDYETTYSTALGGFKPAANPKATKPSISKPQATPPIRSRTAKGNSQPSGSVKLIATSS